MTLWRLTELDKDVGPRKDGKKLVKDMDDLHTKWSDAVDCGKWRRMMRGNWSDRSIDSEAES